MSFPTALATLAVVAVVATALLLAIAASARRVRSARLSASPRVEPDGTWYFERHRPAVSAGVRRGEDDPD